MVEILITVSWTFKADNGMYRTVKLLCYYIQSANTRIIWLVTSGSPGTTLPGQGLEPQFVLWRLAWVVSRKP